MKKIENRREDFATAQVKRKVARHKTVQRPPGCIVTPQTLKSEAAADLGGERAADGGAGTEEIAEGACGEA